MTNDEGGTDDEEFRVAAVKDRVDTTVQVWMGLTMGCAKCHSHKYDPITQKEYYRFYAFFNQTADNDRSDDSPSEPFPAPADQARVNDLKERIGRLEARLAEASTTEASRPTLGTDPPAAIAEILRIPRDKRTEAQTGFSDLHRSGRWRKGADRHARIDYPDGC